MSGPFEEVAYWEELLDILEWSKTHCLRGLVSVGVRRHCCTIFHDVPKHDVGDKMFGVYEHKLGQLSDRPMRGFTDLFPMPVSRYTENRRDDFGQAGLGNSGGKW